MPEVSVALAHDLSANNFANGEILSAMIQAADDPAVIKRLLGEDYNWEVIFRAKHDTSNRPGAHLSPAQANQLNDAFEELARLYNSRAARFDNLQVFSPILLPLDQRCDSRVLVPAGLQTLRFRDAIRHKAWEEGGWIGVVDIEDFYGSVSPGLLLKTLTTFNADPLISDRLTNFIEVFGWGLPQGYVVADLAARLLLTLFDEWATKVGLSYVRFVDDIYVFGSTKSEVQSFMSIAESKIRALGLKVSPSKRRVICPDQVPWAGNGVIWGSIPINDYVTTSEFNLENFIGLIQYNEGWVSEEEVLELGGLDLTGLYKDHFAPGKQTQSDSGNRFVLSALAQLNSESLHGDVYKLIRERSSNAKYVLGFIDDQLRQSACEVAFSGLCPGVSLSDDRVQVISKARGATRQTLIRQAYSTLQSFRGSRQNLMMLSSGDEALIEITHRHYLDQQMWADEKAAYVSLVARVGGRLGRTTRCFLERDSVFGLMFDIHEDILRNGAVGT